VSSALSFSSGTQNFPFVLRVDSVTLESTTYELQVRDNLTSDEGPTQDRIVLNCLGPGTPCTPETISGAPQIDWSFSWTLAGSSGVLDGADIPSSVENWNQLSPSSILVAFQDRTLGRGTGFQATVGNIQIVPEPDASVLTATLFLVLLTNKLDRTAVKMRIALQPA
jgi:hypothetical protein